MVRKFTQRIDFSPVLEFGPTGYPRRERTSSSCWVSRILLHVSRPLRATWDCERHAARWGLMCRPGGSRVNASRPPEGRAALVAAYNPTRRACAVAEKGKRKKKRALSLNNATRECAVALCSSRPQPPLSHPLIANLSGQARAHDPASK